MSRWKLSLIFEGRGKGWSENFYFENGGDSFSNALLQVVNVPPKRAALLGAEVSIKAFRLALVVDAAGLPRKRVSQIYRVNFSGNPTQSADQTNTSLEALWYTADGASKRVAMMGGIWDSVLPAPDRVDPSAPGFQTAWNSWVSTAQTSGLGWLGSGPSEPAVITAYAFDPLTGHTSFTLGGAGLAWPNGLNNPNRVRVEFPLSKSPLDGTYLVIPSSATSAITAKPRPAAPFVVQGKMQFFTPVFKALSASGGQPPYGTILWQVGMSRKRGRPLLESRGRRLVRDLW